ncbi:MAG: orotidine 5'-phosphate decarboxylase [Nitrososphaerota archaeon]|jgi:3-hexulose-6-phosphate synthase|nr:orotidine 5'-phosphate decarboxylase [Nitrososphaerota archaeon]MDG6928280.1 orotidine 5'-phosphate decarboxylase [Nitrososphaerota archaeon]MDG6929742.1 orotidine 5'-phosphate decarboxylase [Nitrososphaerota archaeon]MDG6932822.1 orotidine 5'-phosphate decarboxylase [Nitrososphaerota archaeon]MDG6935379.1 orotidine 5'-phosphate decarboxylase [Nitrososphaerota archaeon]
MRYNSLLKGRNLQVALDLLDLDLAIRIARIAQQEGAAIIEAGTPLIKMYGMKAVRELREQVKGTLILADLKTADVGELEVNMAADAGADIVTVLGCSDNSTVESAKNAAKSRGILLEADTINVKAPAARASELIKLGADIVSFHVSIDQQIREKIGADILKKEIEAVNGKAIFSVAGGLNEKRIRRLNQLQVNIFVVGSAITKSPNPQAAIQSIISAINAHDNI